MEKRYSAFISSNYESLKTERQVVFRYLLDAQIFPFGMEYFTASSSENFKYIKRMIDQSDIFIMLLGDVYGSCDEDGISWTQREYEYVTRFKEKQVFVFLMPEFLNLLDRAETSELSDDERKLAAFGSGIPFAKKITAKNTLQRVLRQSISGIDPSLLTGWERHDPSEETNWQKENKHFDLAGKWYHVHLKESDDNYIRLGTVVINQEFNSRDYSNLELVAENYNVKKYNAETEKISYDHLKRTKWKGDYRLYDDGSIKGIYYSKREFKESYGDWRVERGNYCGIHELDIVDEDNDEDSSDATTMIQGVFKDCTPSQKEGLLYIFRSEKSRLEFLKENYSEVLKSKQI